MPPPDALAPPATLDEAWSDAWARLVRAVHDRRHAFRTPTLATLDPQGEPTSRVVVLRAVDPGEAELSFHTDARSGKVEHLRHQPAVSWCFYDARARLQLRARGTARLADDDVTDRIWQQTSAHGRQTYLVQPGPGTPLPGPASGLEHLPPTEALTAATTQVGREVFQRYCVRLHHLERLDLARGGHRRMIWSRSDGAEWVGQWRVP